MDIATAKQQIKNAVKAYLSRDDAGMQSIALVRQRPMFLVGAPGIGKTAIVEQIAQELGIGMVSYSMTHHTRQSALGLPQISRRVYEGREYDVSEYTMSEIIGAVYDHMEATGKQHGILFLDEINCISETLYPSMLQFLQFKTFGRHRVPEGWVVVCAGNPPEYNRSVHEFDIVTLDRLRRLDVEPDYPAWRQYALEKGVHPAVTSFLQAKPDCFYKVESRPGGGKSFVTARGWEDLAEVIALYEREGVPCDEVLFSQFLCDEDIVDRFSVYYSLFLKYRSDYQVDLILEGQVELESVERAREAAFDERVALLGMVLDALATSCSEALDQEKLVLSLREELRLAKPRLLEGDTVAATLAAAARLRELELDRQIAAGSVPQAYVRGERLLIKRMKGICALCAAEGLDGGPEAFDAISGEYYALAEVIEPLVKQVQGRMANAIEFVEECFGRGRETLVFLAELSTRSSSTQFISRFGSDAYYGRSDELNVDEARQRLSSQVRDLGDIMDEIREAQLLETQALDMGSGAGLGLSDTSVRRSAEKAQ